MLPKIQIPYIALTVLIACSMPLGLAQLPDAGYLFSLLVINILLLCKFRLNCLIYSSIFLSALLNFVLVAETRMQQRLPAYMAKQSVDVLVEVVEFPAVDEMKVRFRAKVIYSKQAEITTDSFIEVSCYRCALTFQLGEIWNLRLRVKPVTGIASWRTFDYEKFALASNVIATAHVRSKYSFRLSQGDSWINKIRQNLRKDLLAGEQNNTAETSFNTRAILLALVIGDRSLIPQQSWSVFRQTGVSHLMAISGLHISLIFLLIKWMSIRFVTLISKCLVVNPFNIVTAQTMSIVIALSAACFYAALTGWSIPTQRALIMLVVYSLAKSLLWQISLFELLCITVLIILVFSPLNTMLTGFWLSVLAVAMIALLLKGGGQGWAGQIRLAAAIMPVTFLFFEQMSWVSPLCNVLFIPVVSLLILPITFLSLLIGFVNQSMSELLIQSVDQLLLLSWKLLVQIADLQIQELGYLIRPEGWEAILLFILISVVILLWQLLIAKKIILILLLALPLSFQPINKLLPGEMQLTVLDVGQGLAIVIQTVNHNVIYDTGIGFFQSSSAEQVIFPFLHFQGIKKLEYIIVSHGDNDHIGGLSALMARFPDTTVLINEVDSNANKRFQHCYGKAWQLDEVNFSVLPILQLKGNNSSCVLHISTPYGDALLPGDIERKAEHQLILLSPELLPADVLILPHHGSQTSSSPAFINKVMPSIGVASASLFSPHNHPHDTVVKRMKKQNMLLLSTATSGSVQIQFTKEGIQTREYRAYNPRFWYSQPLDNNQ